MKKPVVVSILNQKLTVQSDAEDGRVGQVAGFVDGKIQEVLKQARGASTLSAALLTCLNIADDYLHCLEEKKLVTSVVGKKVQALIKVIDQHVGGRVSL